MTCTCNHTDANGTSAHDLGVGCPVHPENGRTSHRHGKAWRDLDGNPIEPLTRRESTWVWGAMVVGVVVWVGVILAVKSCS